MCVITVDDRQFCVDCIDSRKTTSSQKGVLPYTEERYKATFIQQDQIVERLIGWGRAAVIQSRAGIVERVIVTLLVGLNRMLAASFVIRLLSVSPVIVCHIMCNTVCCSLFIFICIDWWWWLFVCLYSFSFSFRISNQSDILYYESIDIWWIFWY